MNRALACLMVFAVIICTSCAPKIALNMKGDAPPPAKYCNDAIGHTPGAKPWILGGTCCCTPTEANYARAIAEGTLESTMVYSDYLKLYQDREITTDLDHKGCNNRCDHGPHVVFGGKCLCTPTPATDNYEEVITGIRKPTPAGKR